MKYNFFWKNILQHILLLTCCLTVAKRMHIIFETECSSLALFSPFIPVVTTTSDYGGRSLADMKYDVNVNHYIKN